MTLRHRAAAMVERVTLEAAHSLGTEAALVVRDAVGAVLAVRDPLIEDDHDPRLLHPARTVLILLSDTTCRDAAALAAAAFIESLDTALRAPLDELERVAGGAARGIASAAPNAARGTTLEDLVSAPRDSAVIAIAERLDHARHLHLRPDLAWAPFHADVETVWAPAAHFLAPGLGRRLDRWADGFRARRLLRPPHGP
ncbi:MAG TPA: hypothetical protein VK929_11455 [Longimicrobiales bacterium]|nr:hypothetical protein [Longimicrobiales bacterium]